MKIRDNKNTEKSVLWVIGDSTLSSFEDKCFYPRYGYGTMLGEYLDQQIEVRNIALSGRSSKSFTTEPEYQELISGMKKGDYLVIGFGHNDEKTEEARYTNANGDYREEGTFAYSLYENYIKKAEEVGCQTILCTPIVRRTPTGQWTQQELHITGDAGEYAGGDYPQAVRDLGKALGLPVVDMTEKTRKLYEEMKPENTAYLHAWLSNKSVSVDNTHTNVWGARVNAYLVMKEIKKQMVAGISEHIIGTEEESMVMDRDRWLTANPDYKPTVFDANLKKSDLWEDVDGFHGTVFGDIGGVVSKEFYTLEKDVDGNLHMAARQNKGKIASNSDGIAMYYRKVPANATFTLKAKVKINDYFYNDQVSFGLMVRDDCYLDQPSGDLLGDYVAAAPLLLTHEAEAWNCFARKSGVLTQGGTCSRAYRPGDEIDLEITGTSDGYACKLGDEPAITGGFDFKLTSIDSENVYAGMFVSRNADVTFSKISLTINGKEA